MAVIIFDMLSDVNPHYLTYGGSLVGVAREDDMTDWEPDR